MLSLDGGLISISVPVYTVANGVTTVMVITDTANDTNPVPLPCLRPGCTPSNSTDCTKVAVNSAGTGLACQAPPSGSTGPKPIVVSTLKQDDLDTQAAAAAKNITLSASVTYSECKYKKSKHAPASQMLFYQ